MWCDSCQADVPAELSADQRRLLCARCRSDVALSATEPSRGGGPRLSGAEQNARDLLARWSADALLDVTPQEVIESAAATPTIKLVPASTVDPRPSTSDGPKRTVRVPRRPFKSEPPQMKSWTVTAAQLIAYGGVAGLTYGAALVLWSYFGGPSHYAPTGWLLTTVGQMFLFLGLITLVANQIERQAEQADRRWRELIAHFDHAEAARRRRLMRTAKKSRAA